VRPRVTALAAERPDAGEQGGVLFSRQRCAEALSLRADALGLAPRDATAWNHEIETLKALGRHRTADEAARRRAAVFAT
jgi:hypothetical protein